MVDLKIDIPGNFYDEEIRCGYTVTSDTKRLWAVELDLLAEFDRICKENGLLYWASSGTMLGAVRHQGFIPWDDDIDVYMFRDDYNKLLHLEAEFKYPYFLQNTYTEPNLFRTHAQLRNSNTTGSIESDKDKNINRGIFIDIFPIDGVKENDKIQKCVDFFLRKLLSAYNETATIKDKTVLSKKIKIVLKKVITVLFDKNKLFSMFEKNLSKYSKEGIKLWGSRTILFHSPRVWNEIEVLKELEEFKFEFLTIPIPQKYDQILRKQYGDYMKIPDNKTGGNWHGELTISTDISYVDYFK